jgi:hypothetical protein
MFWGEHMRAALALAVLVEFGGACAQTNGYISQRETVAEDHALPARVSLSLAAPVEWKPGSVPDLELIFVNRSAVRAHISAPRPGSWDGSQRPFYQLIVTDAQGNEVTQAILSRGELRGEPGLFGGFSVWPDSARHAYRADRFTRSPWIVRPNALPGVYRARVFYLSGASLDRPRQLESNEITFTIPAPSE